MKRRWCRRTPRRLSRAVTCRNSWLDQIALSLSEGAPGVFDVLMYCLFAPSSFGRERHRDTQAEQQLTFYSDTGQSSTLWIQMLLIACPQFYYVHGSRSNSLIKFNIVGRDLSMVSIDHIQRVCKTYTIPSCPGTYPTTNHHLEIPGL